MCPPENSTLSMFINMLNYLNEPWGIKSEDSRHIYMNKAARSYTATPLDFDIEGKFDEDFPAEWAESAAALKEHDRRAKEQKSQVAVIETDYWYGNDYLVPYISEKIPVYNEGGIILGVLWNAKPLNTLSPIKYISRNKPTILTTSASTDLFSKSELNVVFLLLHRYSVKEIARIYGMSHRTIGNRVQSLYQKAGVHSFRQFEEYCKKIQLDNYIPACLIRKGIQFL